MSDKGKDVERIESLNAFIKRNTLPFSEIETINFFRQIYKLYEESNFLDTSFDIKKSDITVASVEDKSMLTYKVKFNLQNTENKLNDADKIARICLDMLDGKKRRRGDELDEKINRKVLNDVDISMVFKEILEKVLFENDTFQDLKKTYFFNPFLKSKLMQ